MRLNVDLLLMKLANGNEVGAGKVFEFGNVKSAALWKFFDDSNTNVFKRVKFSGGGTGVLSPAS